MSGSPPDPPRPSRPGERTGPPLSPAPAEPRDSGGSVPPLSPEAWQRLEPLLDAVLDAPPARRGALLAELCAGDEALRRELEQMLVACERGYPLLDAPAAERFAAVLEDEPLALPEVVAGQYRILGEAGRGGMAVVYLARDLKHDRDVALKVVRPELAASLARVRFLHEIGIAARLRHPHIVPLYDSGELPAGGDGDPASASFVYYVMPFETGRSLRERLEQDGALASEDVVQVLRDVGDALAHAHQHGIVHRDIKPDNVLLSGRHALVSDFGVARAVTAASAGAAAGPGSTALGTPAYMAPEQATPGALVDHRADIYALGVLGFELLTGRLPWPEPGIRPASAEDAERLLVRLRPEVPPTLARALGRCLDPRPEARWQRVEQLLSSLAPPPGALAGGGAGSAPRPARKLLLVGGAAVAALLLVAVLMLPGLRARSGAAPLRLGRAAQLTSERGLEVQPSISPDGRSVAFAAGNSLRMRIAVKPAGGGRARWLVDDSAANQWSPRWAPDGRRILFLSGGGVYSAPAAGGAARLEIASRPGAPVRAATWSPDGGAIAYVRGDSLLVRSLRSGATRLLATAADLHSCRWAPDGRRLACVAGNSFYVTVGATSAVGPMFGNLAPSTIVLVPAEGGRPLAVTDGSALNQSPVWSPDARTLYFVSNRDGPRDVYALDLGRRGAAGQAPTRVTTGMGAQSLDFSADGRQLVYAAYGSTANAWAIPIPRTPPAAPVSATPASARPVTTGNQTVEGLRISADGRWLVYDSDLAGNSDVYRVPLAGGEPQRLTRDSTDEFRGALSPDGRELAFHAFRAGVRQIFLLSLADGTARRLTRASGQLAMPNWSPDGRALSFFDMATADVLVLRRDGRGRWGSPRAVARGWRPEWSPDGRTLAFVSPSDGRIGLVEPDAGTRRSLYTPGTGEPLAELAAFSPDGRQLYFKSHDGEGRASFWTIPVRGGRPHPLVRFDDPAWSSNRFDFASDGKRFYFTVEDRQSDIWLAAIASR